MKKLSKNIQEFQIQAGINSPKMSILLNVPKYGGMKSVMSNWIGTGLPRQ